MRRFLTPIRHGAAYLSQNRGLDVDPVKYSRLGDRNISVLTTAYFCRNARLNDMASGPTRKSRRFAQAARRLSN